MRMGSRFSEGAEAAGVRLGFEKKQSLLSASTHFLLTKQHLETSKPQSPTIILRFTSHTSVERG